MFCCTFLYVHSSIANILMGKRELLALLNLSSWCLVMVERLFFAAQWGCLRFVIVVFPDHTHLLFFGGFAKTNVQTSLPIRAVWSASWLFSFWKVSYLDLLVSITEEAGLSLALS